MQENKHIPLDEALTIQGPHKLQFAPNAYSFGRKRQITHSPTFWPELLASIGITDKEIEIRRRRAFRVYFENMWGITPENPISQELIDLHVKEVSELWPAYIHLPSSVYTTTAGEKVDNKFYIFDAPPSVYRLAPYAKEEVKLITGCVIKVPLANGMFRWYQPLIQDDLNAPRPAAKNDFDFINWKTVWDNIAELVHVFFAEDPGEASVNPTREEVTNKIKGIARRGFSAVDVVRADAALIDQQYKSLENDRKLALTLAERASKLLSDTIPTASISTLPTLTFQYRELNSYLPRVESIRQQLADAASDIGYKLFLEPTNVKYVNADGTEKDEPLPAGKLFKEGQRTVSWITYQTVTETQRSWFRKRTVSYQVPIENRKSFTYYERAQIDYDPWTEAAEAYRKDNYSVYLFRETTQGLVTADGSSIEEVMRQCKNDEEFRLNCVIGIPFYENTIVGERIAVGYVLLVRPLSEISPSIFPSISIDEQLTYMFAWEGVALGELAATIPLAPGEERTVTVAVSQRYKTTRSVTTSSLSEITRVDKSDFETVFEKEVRREKESTSSSGGSVGGSYAGFSGSANFSASTTTKDMSRQLNRSVQRASQELNRRSKDENSISVTEESETSTNTSTSYKLKNINEGRTLNITFYRLMNNYRSNLYLRDFDFYIEAGQEIVMGTGIKEGRTFSRTRLDKMWDYLMQPGIMPIDISDKSVEFKIALCKALAVNLEKEYNDSSTNENATRQLSDIQQNLFNNIEGLDSSSINLAVKALLNEPAQALPVYLPPAIVEKAFKEGLLEFDEAILLKILASTFQTENCKFEGFINKAFTETTFSFDSGGLHADAQVGLRPATEEYSERMRALEEKGKQADQRLVIAKADHINSRSAKNLIMLDQIIDKSKLYVTDRTVLYEPDNHVYLKLRLSFDLLSSEGWSVIIKNEIHYLQNSSPTLGILEFKLPRIYAEDPWDLGNKSHEWYQTNVSVRHEGLRLTLSYKKPSA
ncbi:MAG: hypothetical protein JWR68_2758 [Polaromonas sp.]|nr:hypothetical protein [Polaromonas sp.]